MKTLEKREERNLFVVAQCMALYYLAFGWVSYFLFEPPPVAGVSRFALPVFLTGLAAFMCVMACVQFKALPPGVRLLARPFAPGLRFVRDLCGSLSLETR